MVFSLQSFAPCCEASFSCSVLEASNEASLRQAQSASDQCKRLMDENEELKQVIGKLKSQGKKVT